MSKRLTKYDTAGTWNPEDILFPFCPYAGTLSNSRKTEWNKEEIQSHVNYMIDKIFEDVTHIKFEHHGYDGAFDIVGLKERLETDEEYLARTKKENSKILNDRVLSFETYGIHFAIKMKGLTYEKLINRIKEKDTADIDVHMNLTEADYDKFITMIYENPNNNAKMSIEKYDEPAILLQSIILE